MGTFWVVIKSVRLLLQLLKDRVALRLVLLLASAQVLLSEQAVSFSQPVLQSSQVALKKIKIKPSERKTSGRCWRKFIPALKLFYCLQ